MYTGVAGLSTLPRLFRSRDAPSALRLYCEIPKGAVEEDLLSVHRGPGPRPDLTGELAGAGPLYFYGAAVALKALHRSLSEPPKSHSSGWGKRLRLYRIQHAVAARSHGLGRVEHERDTGVSLERVDLEQAPRRAPFRKSLT